MVAEKLQKHEFGEKLLFRAKNGEENEKFRRRKDWMDSALGFGNSNPYFVDIISASWMHLTVFAANSRSLRFF
jgi:hypothetical protein